jgi:hypothetical protein
MPAMKASQKRLDSYIDAAKTKAEKKKRVARVNLMKVHKKGHKAQHHNITESIMKPTQNLIVVQRKYNI